MSKNKPVIKEKNLAKILIGGGFLGLAASFFLTHEKIKVLEDPSYVPNCNINPIFSCGSVMSSPQSNILDVPNTIFGLMAFSILVFIGLALLMGSRFDKKIWQISQIGATIGLIFMHYLFFQGVFRIDAICPWCFLTWIATIPIFIYMTAYNLESGNLNFITRKLPAISQGFVKNRHNILAAWYVVIFLILLVHFWYYWKTLI